MKYTFHIAGPSDTIVRKMFEARGFEYEGDLTKAHVVVFTGGADVCPFLYGEKPLDNVKFDADRDMLESREYRRLSYGQIKIGICRGAQFLNVMNGGSMWQHVEGHLGNHPVKVQIGKDYHEIMCSSTHHQMMIPNPEGTVIGWGKQATLKENQFKNIALNDNPWTDVEIVEYWQTNTICFQPHPEYGPSECTELFFNLLQPWLPKSPEVK